MTNEISPEVRHCARVLIADERDNVLLLHSSGYVTPESEYYVTVGGGVEEGESLAEAAAREAFEETGLRVAPADLGPVVARTEGVWHAGHQDHSYFFLRTERFDVSFANLEPIEAADLNGLAWLSIDQLQAADEAVFPVPIASLVKRLLSGETPPEPVELEWANWRGDNKRCPLP
ncbi:NUDIX domain-containing protein [Glycomyces sp. L485]|uniref:NUDIX domain-containing protein n=1 Tax=Glycomyces sp. L485 TaxID=2909235 RepID=UPI001F4A1685|nr:NUDIX domain-containing protein [Glycomyces sp. L485]MCH7229632.1 NUDIX domain-containing protein [Glycomyces sp. L485]